MKNKSTLQKEKNQVCRSFPLHLFDELLNSKVQTSLSNISAFFFLLIITIMQYLWHLHGCWVHKRLLGGTLKSSNNLLHNCTIWRRNIYISLWFQHMNREKGYELNTCLYTEVSPQDFLNSTTYSDGLISNTCYIWNEVTFLSFNKLYVKIKLILDMCYLHCHWKASSSFVHLVLPNYFQLKY